MNAVNIDPGGISFIGCDPTIPASAPNAAPGNTGIAGVADTLCCGGNEQNSGTIWAGTIDSGYVAGAVPGTLLTQVQPVQG